MIGVPLMRRPASPDRGVQYVSIRYSERLAEAGIDVAIDDFGVGNSSLNYIQNYDFNVVKIDRIFIADIHRNHKNLSIVKGLVHMAKDLGMIVVAEGVESESQVKILKELGVDKMQDFYFTSQCQQRAHERLK